MYVAKPIAVRFWPKVNKTEGCWLWTGHVMKTGYGSFGVGNGMRLAHRVSYELARGQIPVGLQIDHLCRVRNCVNPAHLEAVTQYENIARGEGPSAKAARWTHCPKGHPLSGDNMRIIPRPRGRRSRQCLTCWRVTRRGVLDRYNAKRRERRRNGLVVQ